MEGAAEAGAEAGAEGAGPPEMDEGQSWAGLPLATAVLLRQAAFVARGGAAYEARLRVAEQAQPAAEAAAASAVVAEVAVCETDALEHIVKGGAAAVEAHAEADVPAAGASQEAAVGVLLLADADGQAVRDRPSSSEIGVDLAGWEDFGTVPDLTTLRRMSKQDLGHVHGFQMENRYARIDFGSETVDLWEFDPRRDACLTQGEVSLYGNPLRPYPAIGQGLNRPATVSILLENFAPNDGRSYCWNTCHVASGWNNDIKASAADVIIAKFFHDRHKALLPVGGLSSK